MKLITNRVIHEQKNRTTSYLSIPTKYVIRKNLKVGQTLYVSYSAEGLEYGIEKRLDSYPVKISGFGHGYMRVSIPQCFDFKHDKGSRYDAYISALDRLVFKQI